MMHLKKLRRIYFLIFLREEYKFCKRNTKWFEFFATAGIPVLIDKSFITLNHGLLCMHDLLQMMAFTIVRTKSTEEPRKGSWLWIADEIYHALKYKRVSTKLFKSLEKGVCESF